MGGLASNIGKNTPKRDYLEHTHAHVKLTNNAHMCSGRTRFDVRNVEQFVVEHISGLNMENSHLLVDTF